MTCSSPFSFIMPGMRASTSSALPAVEMAVPTTRVTMMLPFILVFGGAVTFTSSSITLLKTESLADTSSPFVCAETVVAKKAKRIVAVVFIVKLV